MGDFVEVIKRASGSATDPIEYAGPPIVGFAGGWAVLPFVGRRSHFWDEVKGFSGIGRHGRVRAWEARCNAVGTTSEAAEALHEATTPRCKRCLKAVRTHPVQEDWKA